MLHHLHLLRNVVRVHLHPAHNFLRPGAVLNLLVIERLATMRKLERIARYAKRGSAIEVPQRLQAMVENIA